MPCSDYVVDISLKSQTIGVSETFIFISKSDLDLSSQKFDHEKLKFDIIGATPFLPTCHFAELLKLKKKLVMTSSSRRNKSWQFDETASW